MVASDLLRTQQTAELILKERDDDGGAPSLELDPRLREYRAGAREGRPLAMSFEDIAAECEEKGIEPRVPETRGEVAARGQAFLHDLVAESLAEQRESAHDVLVVSHGGFIRTFLSSVWWVTAFALCVADVHAAPGATHRTAHW